VDPLVLYWTWEIPGAKEPPETFSPPPHSAKIPVHPLIVDGQVVIVGHSAIHGFRLPEPGDVPPGDTLAARRPEVLWVGPPGRSENVVNSQRGQPPALAAASEGILATPFLDIDSGFGDDYLDEEDIEKVALITLSLAEEGSLEGEVVPSRLRLDQRGGIEPLSPRRYDDIEFSGAPAIVDGRVYIAATRARRLVETLVFCFELTPSPAGLLLRPHWSTSVSMGAGRKVGAFAEEKMDASSVAVRNGVLYLCSNTGAIAALDAETGDILWIYAYETADFRLGLYTREVVSPTTWFHNPVMMDHRYVYAAPVDSRYLHILFQQFQRPDDARTLDVAHDEFDALKDVVYGFDPEYLVGAQDGVVFLAGSSRGGERPLLAVKAGPAYYGSEEREGDQNRIVWRAQIEEDAPSGRGVLAGDALFFPTGKGIYRVEVADGRVTKLVDPAKIPLLVALGKDRGDRRIPGNLAVAGPWLVSASDRIVSLFGPPPEEKEKSEKQD
jgi:hypothetical protein